MVQVAEVGGFCVDCGQELSRRRYTRCRSCFAKQNNHRRAYFRPVQARQMSLVEAAWVGALIEGEGCIGLVGGTRVGITVGSTSVETISTILRLVGAGRVHLSRQAGCNYPVWYWTLAPRNDLLALGPQICPFLTDKQERMSALLGDLSYASS